MTRSLSDQRTIHVVMTCHNRREATLRCLRALQAAAPPHVRVNVFLTDDGSTDGTSEAVKAEFPEVHLAMGDGSLYWAAGMALAERMAMASEPDFLLWLNDDTLLDADGLDRMLTCFDRSAPRVVVGATRDPVSGSTTYGGRLRPGRHPLRLVPVPASAEDQAVDVFNGNCVLIPISIRLVVGPIDGVFAHAYADDDYSYRVTAHGYSAVQVGGTVGTCARDSAGPALGIREAWRHMNSPKGMPWRSQARFLRRHAGPTWPVLLLWGQTRYFVRSLR